MEFAADGSPAEVTGDDCCLGRDHPGERGKHSGGCIDLAALLNLMGGEVTNEVLLDPPERVALDVYGTKQLRQFDEPPLFDA